MEDALHICKFQYKAVILALTTGMYMSFQKPINVETLTKSKFPSNTLIPMNAAAVLHNRGQQTFNLCALPHQLRMCE